MDDYFSTYIVAKKSLTPDICAFKINIPEDVSFHFIPGQYIHLTLPEVDTDSGFSVTSVPWEHEFFTLAIKNIEGELTQSLFELDKGDEVEISRPEGNFTLDVQTMDHAVLVGGGIGITPLLSMYRTATAFAEDIAVDLFFSAKSKDELIYRKELQEIANQYEQFNFHPTLTKDQWDGREGRYSPDDVLDIVDTGVPDSVVKNSQYFVCGPDSMNYDMKTGLQDHGVSPDNIMTENFYETD